MRPTEISSALSPDSETLQADWNAMDSVSTTRAQTDSTPIWSNIIAMSRANPSVSGVDELSGATLLVTGALIPAPCPTGG